MYYASIQKINGDIKSHLIHCLEYIHWKDEIKRDSTVFVKPNFTYPKYSPGVTTNPELLRVFLELLKSRTERVILGESDGGNHTYTADAAFEGHCMNEICRQTGVELINLSKIESSYFEEVIQGRKVKVQLPNLLVKDIDCFISVPVMKVHVMTNISLSIKNLWGCYPDTMRCLHHKNLSYKLTLITKLLKPKLCVVDGTYALDGHGPMYGTPIPTNIIFSANNPVVADSIGATLMGIPISKVEHLMVAEKEGLGTTDLSKVSINDDLDLYKMKFCINRTTLDALSLLPFNSEFIAKCVMDSLLTPIIYKFAHKLRTSGEREVAICMKGEK